MVRFEVACELPFGQRDYWRIRATPTFLQFIVEDGLLRTMQTTPVVVAPDGTASREQFSVPGKVDCPAVVRAVVGDTLFGVTDCQSWNDEQAPYVQQFKIRPSFLASVSRTSGTLHVEQLPASNDNNELTRRIQSTCDGRSITIEASTAENEAQDADKSNPNDLSAALSTTAQRDVEAIKPESTSSDKDELAWTRELPSSERCLHIVRGETRVSIITVGWFVERAIAHNLRLFYDSYPATVARFRQKLVERYADGNPLVPLSEIVDRYLADEVTTTPSLDGSDDHGDTATIPSDLHSTSAHESVEDCQEQERDAACQEFVKTLEEKRSGHNLFDDADSELTSDESSICGDSVSECMSKHDPSMQPAEEEGEETYLESGLLD